MMFREISVARLIELLSTLPPYWDVTPNAVSNLKISVGGEYKGYVSFINGGAVELDEEQS